MRDLITKLRWWIDDRFPERKQRFRALGVLVAICVCAVWIGVFAVGAMAGGTVAGPRPTPQIRHAQDLTKQLHADAAYAGISILPHIDYPGKLHVTGTLPAPASPADLQKRLEQLDPKGQFVIDVR